MGGKMSIAKKAATIAVTSALLLGGGMASAAVAAGAGGGNFTCTLTGVPGWGTVRSQYSHPSKDHWATAHGNGEQTIQAGPGKMADAAVGRALSGNTCNWGVK